MKKNHLLTLCALLLTQFSFGQWTILPSGTNADLIAIDFADEQHGIVVGANTTILLTTDGGSSWTAANTGEIKSDFRSVYMLNTDTIFVAGGDIFDNQLYRSVDGGQTWQPSIEVAEIAKSKLGLIGMNYEGLYYSTDRGNQWDTTDLNLGSTLLMEKLDFADSSTGYLSGNVGGFLTYSTYGFRTIDGGLNWSPFWVFDFPNNHAWTNLSAPDPDTVYLFTNTNVNFLPGPDNQLLRMTGFYVDANTNFQDWRFKSEEVNTNMPGLIMSSRFLNGSTGYAGSEAGDIYVTQNGGQDWALSYDGDTTIYDIIDMDGIVLFAVGGNGLIVKLAPNPSSTQNRVDYQKIDLYPNPVREALFLRDFPEPVAKCNLRSSDGKLVRTFTWTQGESIPVNDLASGAYYLELQSGKTLYRSRFLKQ